MGDCDHCGDEGVEVYCKLPNCYCLACIAELFPGAGVLEGGAQ